MYSMRVPSMHKNVDKGAQYEYGVGKKMDEMRVVFYPQVVGDSRYD